MGTHGALINPKIKLAFLVTLRESIKIYSVMIIRTSIMEMATLLILIVIAMMIGMI